MSDNQLKRKPTKKPKGYKEKYNLSPNITNKYCASFLNPTVQPDEKTQMGVPIPSELNTEFSREYQQENEL